VISQPQTVQDTTITKTNPKPTSTATPTPKATAIPTTSAAPTPDSNVQGKTKPAFPTSIALPTIRLIEATLALSVVLSAVILANGSQHYKKIKNQQNR
jgi:hypothetical protein